MDINQPSQQMDIVWKINFSSRECRGEKINRFARTFRLVENRLKAYFPLDEKFARGEIFIPMGMRNKIIMQ